MDVTMSKRWYVLHTYSGHENKVKTNLEKAIDYAGLREAFGQILVVTEDFAEMKNGKRTVSKKKTFPSYVLIEMDISPETQALVQNIPGVTRFVGTATRPMPLREEEVERILNKDQAGKTRTATEVPFKVGQHVRVVDGPFNDFTGVIDDIDQERGKVKVMVSIFGRATPVELDFLQVRDL
jgi:transcriptional antiterminator NusG